MYESKNKLTEQEMLLLQKTAESQETLKSVLGDDYIGGFSVGILQHPTKVDEYCLHFSIDQDPKKTIPAFITLENGRSIDVIVDKDFKPPQVQKMSYDSR